MGTDRGSGMVMWLLSEDEEEKINSWSHSCLKLEHYCWYSNEYSVAQIVIYSSKERRSEDSSEKNKGEITVLLLSLFLLKRQVCILVFSRFYWFWTPRKWTYTVSKQLSRPGNGPSQRTRAHHLSSSVQSVKADLKPFHCVISFLGHSLKGVISPPKNEHHPKKLNSTCVLGLIFSWSYTKFIIDVS